MKLFGIPITIRPMFLVVTLFLGASALSNATEVGIWLGVVLVSIVVHELGHALVGRLFGLVPRIELHGMGGVAIFSNADEVEIGTWQSVAICLAGPLAGFLLGALVLLAVWLSGPAEARYAKVLVELLLWVNFAWGLVNLLPLYPLDGGQVLAALLHRVDQSGVAVRAISVAVALAATIVAATYQMAYAAILAAWFGLDNLRGINERREARRDERLWQELERAEALYISRDLAAAREKLAQILAQARSEPVKDQTRLQLARVLLEIGEVAEARTLIGRLPRHYRELPDLQIELLVVDGRADDALAIARRLHEQQADQGLALLIWTLMLCGRHADLADRLETIDELDATLLQWFREAAARAHYGGQFAESAALSRKLFSRTQTPLDAFNVACSLSRDGARQEALTWLGHAVEAGDKNLEVWNSDPDLEELRGDPTFQSLRSQVERAHAAAGNQQAHTVTGND